MLRLTVEIVLLGFLVASVGLCAERPLLDYTCDPAGTAATLTSRLPETDAELIAQVNTQDRLSSDNALAEWAADQLFRLHETTGSTESAERAATILRALAGPRADATDAQLRVQITDRGALDRSNLAMRDVAWDLARLHRLSGDPEMAHRSAVILQRLAEVMPGWPLVTREGELRDQDDEAYRRAWDANGLWGGWFVGDIEAGLPVVRAFDMIHDSGAMQGLGALQQIERDLIRHIPEHYLERPLDLGKVGLIVHLADGRRDVILSSGAEPPFPPVEAADGTTLAGRFAHLRYDADRAVHAYAVDATELVAGEISLTGPGWWEGEVAATHRAEAGDEFDAFETNEALPEGLAGRCLVVDLGGTLTQAFTIDGVGPGEDGSTLIYSRDEPGMETRGNLVKMMYYPGWGIPRPCRFHIADTLLWQGE